jgi:DNA-binding NtrC family response regulator
LFLDEVGEMSLRMQALLLRFLENGEIQAVGSDKQTRIDVRVIAATNRDLSALVGSGHFREDLMYRLRVIHLHVPPLRERPEDVLAIAEHYLTQSQRTISLTPEAWLALERYRWPGNVRELHNVIEQIAWLAVPGQAIEVGQLPKVVQSGQVLRPARERRRQLADDLYNALVGGGYLFWDHIHPCFLSRDITRHDLRELVRRGLTVTGGNYRSLLQLFRIPTSDYKRFMNFLTCHDCRVDYREFRNPHAEPGRVARAGLPLLFPPISVKHNALSAGERDAMPHDAVA